ncbi:MAG: hypothetical protein WBA84_11000 [Carnobacterium sp.]|uniref:hypothetical protein n=1 Tax=Carnobacterium sp. TaxID=48221 RepID=UPI003AA477BD
MRTIEDFRSNYNSIIFSKKLSPNKKNTLLENLLNEIDCIYFDTYKKERSILEQQEEAKELYEDIKATLSES